MGRDLRDIGFNKNEYSDRCTLYGSETVNDNAIKPDAKPLGRFYKKDLEAFAWKRITLGNGLLSSTRHFQGVIETIDNVDIKPDMYVVDQTGMLFVVVDPVVCDDAAKSKVIGTRPTIKRIVTLRGIEKR